MRKIPLTQNQFALVDDVDFEELNQFKWCAIKGKYTFYAVRHVPDNTKKSGWRLILMHRVVLDAKKGQVCDHIDRNGLDNRWKNLRIASYTLNNLNQRIRKNNTSGYKGVSWQKHTNKWVAQISIDKKRRYLGIFNTAKEASIIYQRAFNAQMLILTNQHYV